MRRYVYQEVFFFPKENIPDLFSSVFLSSGVNGRLAQTLVLSYNFLRLGLRCHTQDIFYAANGVRGFLLYPGNFQGMAGAGFSMRPACGSPHAAAEELLQDRFPSFWRNVEENNWRQKMTAPFTGASGFSDWSAVHQRDSLDKFAILNITGERLRNRSPRRLADVKFGF